MTCSCRMSAWPHTALRHGMTLVEMMVTIAIIGLLTSMVLLGIAGATQTAKERRTEAQIARLHEIIMEKWRSYETRRPPVPRMAYGTTGQPVQGAAALRLAGIRELMRMELPDRISDVVDGPQILRPFDANGRRYVPSLSVAYLAQAMANTQNGQWTERFQGAECLYLIVANTIIDEKPAINYFNENEIGDVDNDGMREILDGWGMPIQFLRWAPGFISPLQTPSTTNPALLKLPLGPDNNVVTSMLPYASQMSDPFDPMGVDPRNTDNDGNNDTFALVPLIFSAGPDQVFNIQTNHLMQDGSSFRYVQSATAEFDDPEDTIPAGKYPKNDPYVSLPDAGPTTESLGDKDNFRNHFGQVDDTSDDGHIDNIYNHFLEAR